MLKLSSTYWHSEMAHKKAPSPRQPSTNLPTLSNTFSQHVPFLSQQNEAFDWDQEVESVFMEEIGKMTSEDMMNTTSHMRGKVVTLQRLPTRSS